MPNLPHSGRPGSPEYRPMLWRVVSSAVLVLGALCSVGCDRSPPPPAKVESDLAPRVDSAWSAEDYRRFVTMVEVGRIPLPVLGDSAGRTLLDRFTSPENLAFLEDPRVGLNVRFKDWFSISESNKAFARLYFAQLKSGRQYDSEFLQLLGFQLQICARGQATLDRAYALASKVSKDIPKLDAEVAALRKHSRDAVFVAVGTLERTEYYNAQARARLLAVLVETAPQLVPLLSKEDRVEIAKELEARKTPDALLSVHKNVDILLAALRK